jgi:hypothetical protein
MLLRRAFMVGVTAVCRGWRSLRNTVKSPLFTHLNLLLDLESHLSVRKATRIIGGFSLRAYNIRPRSG